MLPGLEFQVGTGLRFYVWLDMWHPRGPLSQTFPRGPSITGLPTDSLLHNVIEQGRWNWPSVTDFDIQEIVAGLPLIHPNQPDSIRWKSRDGKFSTAAALKMLQPPSAAVRFQWLGVNWRRDTTWASKRWRGKHLLNAAARTMLSSLVYNIWIERNRRRFSSIASTAEIVARKAIEDVKFRIMSASLPPSVQRSALYKVWKIPWDFE
ncbi:UNVERIFIED_CONTAM: hypothetical protein Sradi_6983300 [Sesamum radiatum]|uniref:Reverse transcriptase n=1 Tax=Sesamum radiatum TaxID=300843 RepID=A0AAW2JDS7_SESRA